MPILKRNHRHILAARPIDGKQTRYRIEGVPGLWLYVSPIGTKVWYVRYQRGGRATRTWRWYRIGNAASVGLARATERAQQVLTEVQVDGRDPHADRALQRAETLTFADLFHEWHDRHAKPKLARAPLDLSIYNFHLAQQFARQAVADIRRLEIGRLRDKIARDSGPIASNNVLFLIGRVFNWAVDEGFIEFNPAARMRKAGQSRPRERVLSGEEIKRLWWSLAAMETLTGEHMARGEPGRMLTPATRSVLRLLLLTGQRRGEVSGAEKCELDLANGDPVWTIPGIRTKNGLLHRVPLAPMAAAEFRRAIARAPAESPYVFATPLAGVDVPILATTVTRAMSRLCAEIGIKGASPHDLRRTVGTELARLGFQREVRALVFNHSPRSRGITDAVYNRYGYDKEKRLALDGWEQALATIIALAPSPIAPQPLSAGYLQTRLSA
jgi:integrase